MVSTAEQYALEIKIFTSSKGFRARILRSGAQKRRFQRSVFGLSGRTDFFNRIGQQQSFLFQNALPEKSGLSRPSAARKQ
jgi:hypothetical protein